MKAPETIPRSGTADTCTSYQELLRTGLRHCQELSGDLWTDFNEHDPGVTILQQLCYALTDLSYRTDFEIPDILAAPLGTNQPDQPLYTGDKVLTCNPLTPDDYRKLLYDRIRGLKNAWLVPVADHPLGIKGLYRILVETREEIEDPNDIDEICQSTKQWMRKVRNLGEDVDEVIMLKPQPIRVEATIEIGPKVDPATVLAQVLFDIQNSLIPFPQVQLVDQLVRRQPPDRIWNGPLLQHGALDQQSLIQLKSTVQVQDIARIILQVPGVKRVKNLRAGTPPDTLSMQPIQIKEGHVPRLDPAILKPQPSYAINIELEGGFRAVVNTRNVWSKIQELEAGMRKNITYAARSFAALSYLQVPVGNYRNIEDYFSIQHQFPAIYGLGKRGVATGLVESGKLALRSQALAQSRIRQLRAYLLFFEQPMTDYLAQLSRVSHLFSLDEELNQSYFLQPLAHDPPRPGDPPQITEVLVQGSRRDQHKSTKYYVVFVVDHQGKIAFVTRRLANHAEALETKRQIIESGLQIHNYRISTLASGEMQLMLRTRGGIFLALGHERFTTAAAARSAAEHWTRFMTDLQGKHSQIDKMVKIIAREDLSVQIIDEWSRIVLVSTGFRNQEEREQRIGEILANGLEKHNYRFRPTAQGGLSLDLYNSTGDLLGEGEEIFETELDAEEGVDELITLLRRVAQQENLRQSHLRRLPEVEPITRNYLEAYHEGLAYLARQTDARYLQRRNRILDHLLARFCERFDDAILERLDLRPFGEKDEFYRELTRSKIEFLRDYVERTDDQGFSLGGGRAQACDYEKAQDSWDISGLERRVSLLLGLHGQAGDGHYYSGSQSFADPGYHYVEKWIRREDPQHLKDDHDSNMTLTVAREHILGPRFEGEPDLHDLHHNFVFSSEDSSAFRQLLSSGANPESYRIHATSGTFHVLFKSHSDQATEIYHAHSREEANEAIAELVRYLQGINHNSEQCYSGERMYVLEHILLRPRGEDVKKCRANVHDRTKHGIEMGEDEFYSHRLSVLLPNWPMRFQNNEFKLYAEQLIYENAPAHLSVDSYWLSFHEMKEFEHIYSEWKNLLRTIYVREENPKQNLDESSAQTLNTAADRLKSMIEALHAKQQDDATRPEYKATKAGEE